MQVSTSSSAPQVEVAFNVCEQKSEIKVNSSRVFKRTLLICSALQLPEGGSGYQTQPGGIHSQKHRLHLSSAKRFVLHNTDTTQAKRIYCTHSSPGL